MDIETLAVSAVCDSLSRTELLKPFLNSGDKEPSWDGHIYVYNHVSQTKNTLSGRVPAQIKGKEIKSLDNLDIISFSVEIADLKNYFKDGGIFYFIVYITKNKNQIFYASLLPFDIGEYLKKAGTQKTISISFEKFPEDENSKIDLFLNFLKDTVRHAVLKTISPEYFEKLKNQHNENDLFFDIRSNDKSIKINDLFNLKTYLYVRREDGTSVPIRKINGISTISSVKNVDVGCDGEKYYTSIKQIMSDGNSEYKLSDGISVICNDDAITQIKYESKGNLKQQITDMVFFIDVNEKKSITIDDHILPFEIEYSQKTIAEIENLKERLIFFEKIQDAFDLAGNKIIIDISTFSENDWKIASIVAEAFLEKKSVKLKIIEDCGFCKLKIGNTGLILYGYKTDNGYYSLNNPFRQRISTLLYEERQGFDNIALSIFCLLNKNDFVIGTNIDYDFVYKDITQIDFNDRYSVYVNVLLLEMLRAYDIGTKDNQELIACAEKISEWLYQSTNDDLELLNLLQVYKRQRELRDEEVQQLYNLVESGTKDHKKLTGVYILLEDGLGAQRHYDQMSSEDQKFFDTFPIANLWKRSHKTTELSI